MNLQPSEPSDDLDLGNQSLSSLSAPDDESGERLEIVRSIESRLKGQIPEPQQSKVTQIVQQVISEHRWFSGPQPPPELLAEYERICPGWGSRLLQMGVDEQKHRHTCESRVLDQQDSALRLDHREASYSTVSLVLGFLAFSVIAALGAYALWLGHEKTAITLFGTFSVGVIGTFIKGRQWGVSPSGSTPENKPTPQAKPSSKRRSKKKSR